MFAIPKKETASRILHMLGSHNAGTMTDAQPLDLNFNAGNVKKSEVQEPVNRFPWATLPKGSEWVLDFVFDYGLGKSPGHYLENTNAWGLFWFRDTLILLYPAFVKDGKTYILVLDHANEHYYYAAYIGPGFTGGYNIPSHPKGISFAAPPYHTNWGIYLDINIDLYISGGPMLPMASGINFHVTTNHNDLLASPSSSLGDGWIRIPLYWFFGKAIAIDYIHSPAYNTVFPQGGTSIDFDKLKSILIAGKNVTIEEVNNIYDEELHETIDRGLKISSSGIQEIKAGANITVESLENGVIKISTTGGVITETNLLSKIKDILKEGDNIKIEEVTENSVKKLKISATGIQEIQAGDNITVEDIGGGVWEVTATVPVKKLTAGNNVSIQPGQEDGEFVISSSGGGGGPGGGGVDKLKDLKDTDVSEVIKGDFLMFNYNEDLGETSDNGLWIPRKPRLDGLEDVHVKDPSTGEVIAKAGDTLIYEPPAEESDEEGKWVVGSGGFPFGDKWTFGIEFNPQNNSVIIHNPIFREGRSAKHFAPSSGAASPPVLVAQNVPTSASEWGLYIQTTWARLANGAQASATLTITYNKSDLFINTGLTNGETRIPLYWFKSKSLLADYIHSPPDRITPENPVNNAEFSPNIVDIGINTEGTDTARTESWTYNGNTGMREWYVSRVVYSDAGAQVLYAFVRQRVYDRHGRLYSVSGETRYIIDTPVVIS